MAKDFLFKIQKYIDDNQLIDKGDNVVIGVSGGADSMALFLTLFYLKDCYDLKLYVVHVNHGLRTEAKEEAEYVRRMCHEKGVPFYLKEADVAELAKEQSVGTEEAGRNLRYETFESILREVGGGKIAVAHNQNDLTETMLFNLFRGTGIKGLASIPPKRGNVIRPLLGVGRSEIEAFLAEEEVSFCTDKSNYSDEYSRNRIRNVVIPVIKENATDRAVEHMAETAGQLRELYGFMEEYCDCKYKEYVTEDSDREVVFNKLLFLQEHIYVEKLLIKKAIDRLVPHNRDITHVHLESVLGLCRKPGTSRMNLPYEIQVEASYESLSFSLHKDRESYVDSEELLIGKELRLSNGMTVTAVTEDYYDTYDYGENQYTKCFDYDKINGPLVIRTRQSGDEIVLNKEGGKKKLKDFMIDIKIPATKRDRVFLLAEGNRIHWVIGYRMSEAAKITDSTKRVLKISVSKED